MKKIIFTIAIAVLATFEMSGQQWSGSLNTNGEIHRNGDVKTVNGNFNALNWNQNDISIGFATTDTFNYDNGANANNTIVHYGMTRYANNHVGLSGYQELNFFTRGNNRLSIVANGNVGIGTDNPTERLTVNGKILAEEVKVIQNVPADYVFEAYYSGFSELKPEYTLPTLAEVEAYTRENNHLPEMPSAAEIKEDGLHLSKMTNLLLQKIEELTLYTIEQEKRIDALEAKLAEKE